ncbi:MAG TPA: hypothetical protein VJK54_00535, partial [Chthoniobacterales bacterium]|nr:hypothetical protein [Chthoniobacterales bacterium]
IPVILFNILFARHAKAFFLAFDHFFDPYQREDGEDRGNLPLQPPTPILPIGDAPPVVPPEKTLEVEFK